MTKSREVADLGGGITQADLPAEGVNESKLQVSNAPVNGYALTAQSGNTGGMTWAEMAGGATELLSTVTVSSNVTYVTFSLPSGYNYYELRCEGVLLTESRNLIAQVEAGGSYQTGASDYYRSTNDPSSYIQLTRESITSSISGGYVMVTIFSAKNTGTRTAVLGQSLPGISSSTYNFTNNHLTGGVFISNTEVTAIRLYAATASITGGVFRLYGVK
jgi:hypothetical protein